MIILVDQDGPLADETAHLFGIFRERFPGEAAKHSGERKYFTLEDNFPPHLKDAIQEIRCEKGFYLNFPPVEAGLRAFREMLVLGHEAYICTAPLTRFTHCVPEKFEWVERYLGREFISRIIIAKDKTAVRGDVLIDDRPNIQGFNPPVWEHVLYDAPYNAHVSARRRLNWSNWKVALGI